MAELKKIPTEYMFFIIIIIKQTDNVQTIRS